MSAGKNNPRLTATAADAGRTTLERLATETRATPDQYDKNWRLALGTLGGGNHFIELAEDTDGTVWVTLHSGSRGVGNKIGTHYIKVAQDLCKKMRVAAAGPRPGVPAGGSSGVRRLPARPATGRSSSRCTTATR